MKGRVIMEPEKFSWRVLRMAHIIEMILYKQEHSRIAMLAYLSRKRCKTTDYTLRQLLSTLVRIGWLVRIYQGADINPSKRRQIELINVLCNTADMCQAIQEELAHARPD